MMAGGLGAFSPEDGSLWRTLAACGIWAVLLNGGTLALNSAVDKDDGDVGYLNNPPPLPRGLGVFGTTLMLLGVVASWFLGTAFFVVYLVCFVMSWLYSVPPARLKARGGWDVVINMIGYGALTCLAGWLAVAPRPLGTDWLIFAGFAFLFAAVYPMTQFYQREEDRRKGAQTLAIVLGDRGSMLFIHAALLLANLSWFVAACGRMGADWIPMSLNSGVTPAPGMVGWAALAAQAVLWFAFSADWWARFDRYPHQKGLYRSMVLWAFSNLSLILVFGEFTWKR
jgi:4-hydroxybenzoate polyprenyltransferase